MQPTFNPWLGYFDLIDYVDEFIFLDTVQLNQQSWQTRNKIKVQNKELMISLPIKKNKIKSELLIKDAMLDFSKFDFRKKLYRTLEQSYKKAKYFNEVNNFIKEIIFYDTNSLSEYNINIIQAIVKKLNLKTKIITLSRTEYKMDKVKGDLVLDICKYFKCTEYISPLGSKDYLDKEINKFNLDKIDVYYQYYQHPEYKQLGNDFIPYIGIFDILYNEGFENTIDIIKYTRLYKSNGDEK